MQRDRRQRLRFKNEADRRRFWHRTLEGYFRSGLTPEEFTKKRQLSVYSLMDWKRRFEKEGMKFSIAGATLKESKVADGAIETNGEFLRVNVIDEEAMDEPPTSFETTRSRLRIETPTGFKVDVKSSLDFMHLLSLLREIKRY